MTTKHDIPDDPEQLLARMREEGLPVEHAMFATIHFRSDDRPDGFTGEEMDDIADGLNESDVARWKRELAAHLAKKEAGG